MPEIPNDETLRLLATTQPTTCILMPQVVLSVAVLGVLPTIMEARGWKLTRNAPPIIWEHSTGCRVWLSAQVLTCIRTYDHGVRTMESYEERLASDRTLWSDLRAAILEVRNG